MILCHCCTFRHQDLIKEVDNGNVKSVDDLIKQKKACTDCTGCKPALLKVIESCNQKD